MDNRRVNRFTSILSRAAWPPFARRALGLLVLCGLLLGAVFSAPAFAVPAAPTIHALAQPDGRTFDARQWGDEWNHGWETAEGYSILRDEASRYWVYAVRDDTGKLMKSSATVGQERPLAGVPPRLRPAPEVLSEAAKAFQSIRSTPIQHSIPLSGTANVLTILINFSDRTTTYSSAQFNTLLFGTGVYSMRDYYTEVSYGRFTVSAGPGGVAGWYQASQGHDYYGANVGGDDQWPGDLVYEAVRAADSANFNFVPYDQDGDCQVDLTNIVHQGSGEEAGALATDIWSHSWDLNSAQYYGRSHYGAYTTKSPCAAGGFIRVNRYVIQPEVFSGGMTTMGAFAHEYGHALGLPDLYDTDGTSEGVGNWSLMAGGSWNYAARPGDRPAHPDAWSKYKLGWIAPILIGTGSPQTPTVQPAYAYASVYQLLNGRPSLGGEYFLVENRRKGGFDVGLPGSGLLIWHVDESQTTNNNECYPGGPSCAAQHYHVALVQADNLWNLERNNNAGDGGDPYPGFSNQGNLNGGSAPNSQLYNGSASGVSITNIAVSGSNITATLSTGGDPASFLLTVSKAGAGAGTVTSAPAGINCGSDCSESYPANTTVTLTATAATGSKFTSWTGACSGTSTTCAVAMNAAKSVTATLTLNTTPPGPAVSAGWAHTCGIRSDSTVACWGDNNYGQASPPAGAFTQVSAGTNYHTCGVKSDGTVACWGNNAYGQANPPAGAFTQVSAGTYHTCGLRSDGTLACWGNNAYGQTNPPAGAFTQVSAGTYHTCGLRSDGTLACWGDNGSGQASSLAGAFTQVSAGTYHTCGLRSDGTVACWGWSGYGQASPLAGAFTQVSAGNAHTCGVRSDGTVACWGWNDYGQANPPAGAFTQVSTGWVHTCGVKSDGTVACWGDNSGGQLGPTLVVLKPDTGGSGAVTSSPAGINCGATCSYTYPPFADTTVTLTATAAAGSTFAGWGGACLGASATCTITMDTAKKVTAIFTPSYTLTVSKVGTGAGTVTSTPAGINCGGDCTEAYGANTAVTLTATAATGSTFTGWSGVCTGTSATCTVTMDVAKSVTANFTLSGGGGSSYTLTVSKAGTGSGTVTSSPAGINCGSDCSESYPANTTVTLTATAAAGSTFTGWSGACTGTSAACTVSMTATRSVTANFMLGGGGGSSYTLTVSKTGTGAGTVTSAPAGINCGSDCSESYTSGTTVNLTATAAAGSTFTGWSGACTGTSATCTVTMDVAKSVTATFTLNTAKIDLKISAGDHHTCAIRSDGSIACWGYNSDGQASPPAGGFIRVSAGFLHTCGLRSDGSIACWGYNSDGQASPPAGGFIQVSASGNHTCGIRSDGTAVCWGYNGYGENNTPVGTFTQVSTGGNHTCGLRSDGTAICWGAGTTTGTPPNFGQANPPAGPFTQVSAGLYYTCGLRSDGTVICWGYNGYGQASPPAGNFIQISAGNSHACGLRSDGSAACWGDNGHGEASPPAGAFTQVSAGAYHSCGKKADGTVACWGDNHLGQLGPTLAVSKTGSGTVTSNPVGVNCGTTCATHFPFNSAVALAATPAAGWQFAGWSGACTGTSATCTVTMDAAKSVTANFTLSGGGGSYTLTVTKTGAGSGTVTSAPAGINCGGDCSEIYSYGQSVTLTATAVAGSTFAGWSGACSGTGSCAVTMGVDRSVTATFDAASTADQTLVTQYYQSILGRAPDAGGLAYWQGEIVRLQGLGVDVQEAFRVMAGWFFTSAEYLGRNTSDGQYVTDLYRTFFQRDPDGGGLGFWTGQLAAGMPRAVVLYSFLFSAEFGSYMQGLLGNTASRGEVYAVVDFYRGFLNRLPDPDGFAYWLGRFRAAQCQGATAVNAEVESISGQFAASGEYSNRKRSNRDYVGDLYYAFLRRGGELTGFDFWVSQLDNGLKTREQLRQEFLKSPEFQSRVQQIVSQGCLR